MCFIQWVQNPILSPSIKPIFHFSIYMWAKKLGMPFNNLSLACSMIWKTNLPYKTKNELISNIFANFLSVMLRTSIKSYALSKSQLKIFKNCSILEKLKLSFAWFWKQKAWFSSDRRCWKKLGLASLIKKLGLANQKVGSDSSLLLNFPNKQKKDDQCR